jgi:hypothetical protein
MDKRTKWLLGVTIANLAATAFLALIVWAILEAFAGFAAYVVTWPLFVMFPISVAFSSSGLWLARKCKSAKARWLGYLLNGLPLVVPLYILFIVGETIIHMDRARYIVPEGYQGYVYILHGFPNGVPEEKHRWEVTYRIPGDGVLASQTPQPEGFRETRYFYQLRDGSLKRIPSTDFAAQDRNPEIVAFPNDPETDGYGEASESSNCHVQYEWFHIGTGSARAAEPQWKELAAWLHAHGICAQVRK